MAKKAAKRAGRAGETAGRTSDRGRLLPPEGGLSIRMYRQGLGDCFLLAFAGDDPADPTYVLIDCGVHAAQPDGRTVIGQVMDDIVTATSGRLDVLVVTHEHTDHLSGFVHGADRLLNGELEIERLWLAWTEDETDPAAKRLRKGRVAAKRAVEQALERLKEKVGDAAERDRTLLGLEAMSLRLGAAASFFDTAIEVGASPLPGLADRLGVKDPDKASGNEVALALLKDRAKRSTYLRPGSEIVRIPKSAARCYVLGPPSDPALLNRSDPSAGNRHETYLSSALGLHSFAAALERNAANSDTDDGQTRELSYPFDARFRRPYGIDEDTPWSGHFHDESTSSHFFRERYGFDDADHPEAWRRIDTDWLQSAGELALHLDRHTNNTSLVLAFEIGEPGEGPVLLFVGDAQVGNWLSWKGLNWQVGRRKIDMADLFRRTAVYKVGHHASHNATLRRDETGAAYGLELMPEDLIALVPVDQAAASKLRGWDMPYGPLYKDALLRKTRGNILRSDDGHDARLPIPRARYAAVPGVAGARWRCGPVKKPNGKPLYYDLTLTGGD